MKNNFMSSKDSNEKRPIYSKSDNEKIVTGFDTYKINEEFFDFLWPKHEVGLKESLRGSDFAFDHVDELS